MKRRSFLRSTLTGTLAFGVAATALAPSSALAAKKQRWRLAMAVPRTLPIWGPGVERFAKMVEDLSQGELKIKVYGAGELVPALGTLEAVKAGEIQMGHSAAYYWKGKIPASPFFTSVPFGMDTAGNLSWMLVGGGQDLYNELMSPHDVICMPCGATGSQMGGWYNREIKSIKDLEGLKIRIPGLAATVLAQAGAKPVLLPGGEVFTGLSTGVIDAVEWVGPYHDYVMGFHKAAKFYYGSSWHEPGSLLELMINKNAWESLSSTAQLAVRIAASDTSTWMQANWDAKNSEYLEKLKTEGKISIQPFPDSVLRHLKKIAERVKLDLSTTGPLAKRIYDSYSIFQNRYEDYQSLAARYQPL